MRLLLFIMVLWFSITAMGQTTIREQISMIQDKYQVHFVYDAQLNLDVQTRGGNTIMVH